MVVTSMWSARGAWVCAACGLAAACGRIGFDGSGAPPDGTSPPGDSAQLDDTFCDDGQDLLFCDSYEGASQLPNVEVNPPGMVERTTARAYRGDRSLHTRTTNGIEPAWEIGTVLPSISSGDLHARWYLFLPSSNPARVDVAGLHIVEPFQPYAAISFELRDGRAGIELTTTGATTRVISMLELPRDRWVCIQLYLVVSDTNGAAALAVDGVTVAQLSGADTRPAAGYANVHAGMFSTSSDDLVLDLFTDELAIARSPIACD